MITFICCVLAFKFGMEDPWYLYIMPIISDVGIYELFAKRGVYYRDYINRKRGESE